LGPETGPCTNPCTNCRLGARTGAQVHPGAQGHPWALLVGDRAARAVCGVAGGNRHIDPPGGLVVQVSSNKDVGPDAQASHPTSRQMASARVVYQWLGGRVVVDDAAVIA
jgi:hypothetical protein